MLPMHPLPVRVVRMPMEAVRVLFARRIYKKIKISKQYKLLMVQ
jgi:hypothetical protein